MDRLLGLRSHNVSLMTYTSSRHDDRTLTEASVNNETVIGLVFTFSHYEGAM